MNGAHDMGGMHGTGPIDTDPNDPLFHAELGAEGLRHHAGSWLPWPLEHRHVPSCQREPASDRLPQQQLFRALAEGVERLAVDTGMISAEELATGEAAGVAVAPSPTRRVCPQFLPRAPVPSWTTMFRLGSWPEPGVLVRDITTTGYTACRATAGAGSAPSTATTASTSFPTPTPMAWGRSRSIATASASAARPVGRHGAGK